MEQDYIKQTESYLEMARQIDTLFHGKEWGIFRTLLLREINPILLKEYESFDNYKADRRFITRILKIGTEMQGILNGVPEAEAIIKTASQTPEEDISL